MTLVRILLPVLVTALISACSNERIAGGSEIGNPTISGVITLPDNTPAEGITIRLRSSDYLSPIYDLLPQKRGNKLQYKQDTISGESGRFGFEGAAPGKYVLEAVSNDSLFALINIEIPSGYTLIELDNAVLHGPASVTGAVSLPPHVSSAYIQVYGLERLVVADSLNRFMVRVPA
ncbi:MAG: carboxypeptidase regulatory-like domain-containing protein, partial [Gammaproteobacteria bacterium]|nr:carboxypeptidase regulatory-like domain-containing protein [Gammaproteobacteria bacterium]